MNKALAWKIVVAFIIIAIISAAAITVFDSPQSQVDSNLTNVSPANLVWEKVYGGQGDDRLFSAVTSGNGYLVVGSTKSILPNTMEGWAIMLDGDGNAVWNKTFLEGSGTELRYAINLTDGFLVVGNEYLPSGNINGYAAKMDPQGNLLWQTTIGNNQTDEFYSAIATPDGFILLGLSSTSGGTNPQAWIVKIDGNGSVVWQKTYQFAEDSVVRAGVLTPDQDYMVAGYSDPRGEGNYSFLLMKIDSAGNLVWNQTYGVIGSQEAHSITLASDGYVIVGDTQIMGANIHAWVLKVNFDGKMMWSKTVGGKNADSPAYVTPSPGGGYLVTGFTFSWGAGNRDFWLFKISDSGQVLWSCTQGDAGYQEAYTVIPAGENQYVLAGWTDPPGQPALIGKAQYDFYIVKIAYPQK